ncbi:hypothetical protein RugamoR64_47900 [Duganella rhizosphaerae]|uniref:hypothetical protein n=1 Tax=Duganella rhizosphaerae TaxID=2885763 RepID=UPI0030E93128
MNQPDYCKYNEEQLQQILRSIDAERFPERVAEIKTRLAELAQQGPVAAAPPKISADPASYKPVMRRAAKCLLVVAAVDLGVAVWNAVHGIGSMFNVDLAALAAALLLIWGGLRVAAVLRWMLFSAVSGIVLWFLLLFAQPLDLTLAQIRLTPLTYMSTVLLLLLKGCAWIWVLRLLGSVSIQEARAFEGRKRYDMRKPLFLGLAITLGVGVFYVTQVWGERGRHAEQLAAQRVGGPYRYHTNGMQIMANPNGTFVSANVLVWNEQNIGSVAVNWKE